MYAQGMRGYVCVLMVMLPGVTACRSQHANTVVEAAADASGRPPQSLQLHTDDGWTLAATLYSGAPNDVSGGAVLLVHQLGSNRQEWRPLIERLHATRAVPMLALDLRGHGESTSAPAGSPSHWEDFGNDTERWRGLTHDVSAGLQYLRNTLGATVLVVVGSSIGSSAALTVAAEDSSVAGLVMLSPGLSYHGLDTRGPMQRYGALGRPALLLAGDLDRPSAEAVPVLAGLGGEAVEHEVFGGVRVHGVALCNAEPARWARVEAWVRARLQPRPAAQARDGGTGADR